MDHLQQEQNINLTALVKRVLSKWYWIIAAILFFSGIAYLINRYTHPVYEVTTTLFVDKEEMVDPLSFLYGEDQKPGAGGSGSSLDNEQVILTSFPIMISTLNALDFQISYFFGNRFALSELYDATPINVKFDLTASSNYPYDELIYLYPEDTNTFTIEYGDIRKKSAFGENFKLGEFSLTVNLTKAESVGSYEFIAFKLHPFSGLINEYRSRVRVTPITDNIINVSVNHQQIQKAKDFLNKLSEVTIEVNKMQKQQGSQQIIKFIEDQININSDTLQYFEDEIKQFKNSRVAINPTEEGGRLYSNINLLEEEKATILLSNQYYRYLQTALVDESRDYTELVIPSSVGIADPFLNELVSQLISIQREVKMLLTERKTKNPLLQDKLVVIEELKKNIISNVENQDRANELKIRDLDRRIAAARGSLNKMPQAEQELTTIRRDYTLNENLYMILMQKKMDAGIQAAAVSSDYRVINEAYESGLVSASPYRNYIAAVLLGLIIPIGLILLIDFFDTRIKNREDVSLLTSYPQLGVVPYDEKQRENTLLEGPQMESFRKLRANLRYIGEDKKVLLFTSASSGDGKSFCSQNLALVLSLSDKKVVWVDADMRKSSRQKGSNGQMGLSDYLSGMGTAEGILKKAGERSNLMMIKAGSPPPNPSELLISERMTRLLNELRQQFDYVIIDTPPAGIFSDALELIPQVDQTLMLVRIKHTRQPQFKVVMEQMRKLNSRDIGLILNGESMKSSDYGYGSYYEYGRKKKKRSLFGKKKVSA